MSYTLLSETRPNGKELIQEQDGQWYTWDADLHPTKAVQNGG